MKKLLALSMVAMMALGMTSTINAEEKETTVDTGKTEDTTDGTVWGSIQTDLKQLKVVVPIKIDFVITKGDDTTDGANKMVVGDYKIQVQNNSEIGVELTNITIAPAPDTKWKLVEDATKETDDVHKVDLEIAGAKMAEGEKGVEIKDFEVGVNNTKSLDVKGHGSKKEITENEAATKAFNIVYTIKQKDVTAVETPPAA